MKITEFSWKDASNQTIYACDWQPEGEVRASIALVHGLGEHIGRYKHVAAALNAAGFALTGMDFSGHGRSEGQRGYGSYEIYSKEIDHLLEETAQRYPGKPRFLYGHSMGGGVVLYYALSRRPSLKGIIATSPAMGARAFAPAIKYYLAKMMAKIYPRFSQDNGIPPSYLSRDPEIAQAYASDPLVHPKTTALLGVDLLDMDAWFMAHAAEFPLPLLLEHGDQDKIVAPKAIKAFAQLVPADKLTYKLWEGLSHETHNEPEKQQVLDFMIRWLERTC